MQTILNNLIVITIDQLTIQILNFKIALRNQNASWLSPSAGDLVDTHQFMSHKRLPILIR